MSKDKANQQRSSLASIFEQATDPEGVMAATVRAVREYFDSDNAWLLYPCIPDTLSCRFLFYDCRTEAECVAKLENTLFVTPEMRTFLKTSLLEERPEATHGLGCQICQTLCAGKAAHCSQLSIVLKTKNDQPWLFGLCNCSHRLWSSSEMKTFQQVAKQLTSTYDTLKLLKTFQQDNGTPEQSETETVGIGRHFSPLFQHSSISMWLLDIARLRKCTGEIAPDHFHILFGTTDAAILTLIKKKIKVVDVNTATLRLFSATDKQHLLSSFKKFLTKTSLAALREILPAILQGSYHLSIETEFITLLERPITAILNIDVLPPPDCNTVLVSITDITSRKHLEEKLYDSKEQYRLLLENSSDAIMLIDAESEAIVEANPKAFELTGKSTDQLIGLKYYQLHPPEEQNAQRRLFRDHMEGRIDSKEIVHTLLHHDGRPIPVQVSASRTTLKGRTIIQRIYHNISMQVEEEEQRKLLFTAVEQVAECVVITDPSGIIEYVNPAYERIAGYRKLEVTGKIFDLLTSGEMPEYHHRLLWQEITSGSVWRGKCVTHKKDGSSFTVDVTIAPVKDRFSETSHFVAVMRDITRQDQLEKVVRQSQKMQAIGTLAGGIAHDFNNILTAILGFAELSVILAKGNETLKNNLFEIITASERAGKLIDQVLTFSRQTEKNVSSLRLSHIVAEVLKLLRASLPANVEIITDIQSKAMVRADPTQIHQVVMNLCMNAYQALEKQERWIRIVLDSVLVTPLEGVHLGNLAAGQYATISVEDNGRGIMPEHINRIFEPYFSTREKNEGTGLGLSVVHGIINDHAGAVTVESTPGVGSCFTLYLPEIRDDETKGDIQEREFIKGEGKVLLVDDEQQIVDYLIQVLDKAGYETFATTSSVEAWNMFNKMSDVLDIVITDMAMPQMTGVELYRKIRAVRKDIPVLLCTGYSEHVSSDSAAEMGIEGYLAKPFTAEQLAGEVARMLAEKR